MDNNEYEPAASGSNMRNSTGKNQYTTCCKPEQLKLTYATDILLDLLVPADDDCVRVLLTEYHRWGITNRKVIRNLLLAEPELIDMRYYASAAYYT